MCNRCGNLNNRLPYDRVQAIHATDRYRGSQEHKKDLERLERIGKQLKKEGVKNGTSTNNGKR